MSDRLDSLLADDFFQELCERILQGEILQHILREKGIPASSFYHALSKSPKHEETIEKARIKALDVQADKLQVAHEMESITKARLFSENLKWLLSRRLPKKYGERLAVDVQVVDISVALEEAKRRKVPIQCPENVIEVESSTIQDTSEIPTTDIKSVDDTDLADDDIFK